MLFHNKEENTDTGSYRPEIWQILLPAFLFAVLYTFLQSACLFALQYLAEKGPSLVRHFIQEREGICMAAAIVLPMAAALMPVSGEGIRRIRAFRGRKASIDPDHDVKADIPVWLCLAISASALCIFGNAQIQVMGLHSDSVSAMQPVYREIPFPFILLLFAVFTPFAEELVFRGILYTGLRSRMKPLPSILLTAALFGLYHGDLVQGVYAACMGLLFCLSMEATGDLWAPWLLHCISNGLPLILSYSGLWEFFLRGGWRIAALVCFLLSCVLLGALAAAGKGAGGKVF